MKPIDDCVRNLVFGLDHQPVTLALQSKVLVARDEFAGLANDGGYSCRVFSSPDEEEREVGAEL